MDFDYHTVKYLVIILSLLILGYVIFIIYTDLNNVRGEFDKIKNKLFDTSVSLEELQKQLEYIEDDTNSEISKEDTHVLHDILNNNFFTSEKNSETVTDPENTIEDPVNINSFSFNIPYFNKIDEQQINENTLPSIEEISESSNALDTQQNSEEIKFETSLMKCQGVLASGKNKGNPCTKYTVADSNFCSKHNK